VPVTAERDPYGVLGVTHGASVDDVTAAYRRLARRYHPDVSSAPDAEPRMAEINAAWTLLRDPTRRAAWDRAHGVTEAPRPSRSTAGASRPAPPPSTDRPAATAPPRPGAPFAPGTRATGSPRPGHPTWRRGPNGEGAAGPPPGNPRGSVLGFGRHIGWSLGEIARVDPGYLVWLQGRREGAPYREEIDALLERIRPAATGTAEGERTPGRRRGTFRQR
jgi:curved DNA-binding protein CbpA